MTINQVKAHVNSLIIGKQSKATASLIKEYKEKLALMRKNPSGNKENYVSNDFFIKQSKFQGVYWRQDIWKWVAQIYVNKKSIYLGSFHSETEAHERYQEELSSRSKLKTAIQ